MKIHKKVFVIAFNERKYEYLNGLILKIKQELFEVNFDDTNKNYEIFKNLRLRLVDLRFLQEALRD